MKEVINLKPAIGIHFIKMQLLISGAADFNQFSVCELKIPEI